jgi:hypothetical protein
MFPCNPETLIPFSTIFIHTMSCSAGLAAWRAGQQMRLPLRRTRYVS